MKSILSHTPAAAPVLVPLLDLRRQYEQIREEVLAAIAAAAIASGAVVLPDPGLPVEASVEPLAGVVQAVERASYPALDESAVQPISRSRSVAAEPS